MTTDRGAYPLCLAVAVKAGVLEKLLAEGEVGGYRDAHPWYVAAGLFTTARAEGRTLYLLLAAGSPLRLGHWAEITDIEVHAVATTRETRVVLGGSGPVNPLFEELDTVTLAPAEHQLERERREGLRVRRFHLDAHWLQPYALCETPPFLPVGHG